MVQESVQKKPGFILKLFGVKTISTLQVLKPKSQTPQPADRSSLQRKFNFLIKKQKTYGKLKHQPIERQPAWGGAGRCKHRPDKCANCN
jgi:hypothetical protein